jgi:hypothetical protein
LLSLVAGISLLGMTRPASAQGLTFDTSWLKLATINWADLLPQTVPAVWKCKTASGATCTNEQLHNPYYKQILFFPAGFADSERDTWWSEFDRTNTLMTGGDAGDVWSVRKKSQLLFIGYFLASAPINDPNAIFGASIPRHPVRGWATSLRQDDVYAKVEQLKGEIPGLNPIGVGVLFNSFQTGVTANAGPPNFVQKAYGIAKWTRNDLNERGPYLPCHELGHAAISFLDEYIEAGFENLNIRSVDVLTPTVIFDFTWSGFWTALSNALGIYSYKISEVLANNGNDNITLSPWPSTVNTTGYTGENYAYEHGMFFGLGTFHQRGKNLMNGNNGARGPDDGFAFSHSQGQGRTIDTAFDGWARRPNDRLRTAGPINGWPLSLGSTTHVLLHDGDKNNHWQPTASYTVQVGWYERHWHTCWWGFIPYPCHDDVWSTAQRSVNPSVRSIDLKISFAFGLANIVQQIACGVGYTEYKNGDNTIRLCDANLDTLASQFLPTLKFPMPYQDADVPASQWMTTYWWRFGTINKNWGSGYTGWSSFFRSL